MTRFKQGHSTSDNYVTMSHVFWVFS